VAGTPESSNGKATGPPNSSVLDPALRRLATVTVLGSIMSILDTTIVAVALDVLGRDFKVSIATIQWVTTGYLLALAMVIPVTGWAIDRVGAKRMWIISVTLFMAGSVLCGLAWSAPVLIMFRVLQGLGGGMILPVGQSIVARAAGPQRMGRVMSVIGVPTVLGPVLGPVVGGLIVSNASWRWIFYVNVPIGIVALALSRRWLPRDEERKEHSFDLLGFLLLSPGLTLFVYALSEVGTTGGFSNPAVIGSFIASMILLVAYVWNGVRRKDASRTLLDLHLFRYRTYAIANISILVLGAMLFGSMFLLPLYYQVVRGQSALMAGLLMAPQGLGAALVMRRAGAVTDRVGPRRVAPAGVVLLILGSLPFAFVTSQSSEVLLALSLFIRGIGLGLSMMPMVAAGYTELAYQDMPRATTTINISRQVGGSIATALLAVVLQRHIESSVPGAKSGLSLASVAHVPAAISAALGAAFASTFWWVVAIAALLLIPTCFLPHHAAGQGLGVPKPAKADEPLDESTEIPPLLHEI
jgi:EmrB/QacA subfamily drug resistance transporter